MLSVSFKSAHVVVAVIAAVALLSSSASLVAAQGPTFYYPANFSHILPDTDDVVRLDSSHFPFSGTMPPDLVIQSASLGSNQSLVVEDATLRNVVADLDSRNAASNIVRNAVIEFRSCRIENVSFATENAEQWREAPATVPQISRIVLSDNSKLRFIDCVITGYADVALRVASRTASIVFDRCRFVSPVLRSRARTVGILSLLRIALVVVFDNVQPQRPPPLLLFHYINVTSCRFEMSSFASSAVLIGTAVISGSSVSAATVFVNGTAIVLSNNTACYGGCPGAPSLPDVSSRAEVLSAQFTFSINFFGTQLTTTMLTADSVVLADNNYVMQFAYRQWGSARLDFELGALSVALRGAAAVDDIIVARNTFRFVGAHHVPAPVKFDRVGEAPKIWFTVGVIDLGRESTTHRIVVAQNTVVCSHLRSFNDMAVLTRGRVTGSILLVDNVLQTDNVDATEGIMTQSNREIVSEILINEIIYRNNSIVSRHVRSFVGFFVGQFRDSRAGISFGSLVFENCRVIVYNVTQRDYAMGLYENVAIGGSVLFLSNIVDVFFNADDGSLAELETATNADYYFRAVYVASKIFFSLQSITLRNNSFRLSCNSGELAGIMLVSNFELREGDRGFEQTAYIIENNNIFVSRNSTKKVSLSTAGIAILFPWECGARIGSVFRINNNSVSLSSLPVPSSILGDCAISFAFGMRVSASGASVGPILVSGNAISVVSNGRVSQALSFGALTFTVTLDSFPPQAGFPISNIISYDSVSFTNNRVTLSNPGTASAVGIPITGVLSVDSLLIRGNHISINDNIDKSERACVFLVSCPSGSYKINIFTLSLACNSVASFKQSYSQIYARNITIDWNSIDGGSVIAEVSVALTMIARDAILSVVGNAAASMRTSLDEFGAGGIVKLGAALSGDVTAPASKQKVRRIVIAGGNRFVATSKCAAAAEAPTKANEKALATQMWRNFVVTGFVMAANYEVGLVEIANGTSLVVQCDSSSSRNSGVAPITLPLVFVERIGSIVIANDVEVTVGKLAAAAGSTGDAAMGPADLTVAMVAFATTQTTDDTSPPTPGDTPPSSFANFNDVRIYDSQSDAGRRIAFLLAPQPISPDDDNGGGGGGDATEMPLVASTTFDCAMWAASSSSSNSNSAFLLWPRSPAILRSTLTPFLARRDDPQQTTRRIFTPCPGMAFPVATVSKEVSQSSSRHSTETRSQRGDSRTVTHPRVFRVDPQPIPVAASAFLNLLASSIGAATTIKNSFRVSAMQRLRQCSSSSAAATTATAAAAADGQDGTDAGGGGGASSGKSSMLDQPMGLDASPLQLRIGDETALETYVGCTVGNVILFFVLLLLLGGVILWKARKIKLKLLAEKRAGMQQRRQSHSQSRFRTVAGESEGGAAAAAVAVLVTSSEMGEILEQAKIDVRWPGSTQPLFMVLGLPIFVATTALYSYPSQRKQHYSIFVSIPSVLLFVVAPIAMQAWLLIHARDEQCLPIAADEQYQEEDNDDNFATAAAAARAAKRDKNRSKKTSNSNDTDKNNHNNKKEKAGENKTPGRGRRSSLAAVAATAAATASRFKRLVIYLLEPAHYKWTETTFFQKYAIHYEGFSSVAFAVFDWVIAAGTGAVSGVSLNCQDSKCCVGVTVTTLLLCVVHAAVLFKSRPFLARAEIVISDVMSLTWVTQTALQIAELVSRKGTDAGDLSDEDEKSAVQLQLTLSEHNNRLGNFALVLCFLSLFFSLLPYIEPVVDKITRNLAKRKPVCCGKEEDENGDDMMNAAGKQIRAVRSSPSLQQQNRFQRLDIDDDDDRELLVTPMTNKESSHRSSANIHNDNARGRSAQPSSSPSSSAPSVVKLSEMLLSARDAVRTSSHRSSSNRSGMKSASAAAINNTKSNNSDRDHRSATAAIHSRDNKNSSGRDVSSRNKNSVRNEVSSPASSLFPLPRVRQQLPVYSWDMRSFRAKDQNGAKSPSASSGVPVELRRAKERFELL